MSSCDYCQGSGRVEADQICPQCRGTGAVPDVAGSPSVATRVTRALTIFALGTAAFGFLLSTYFPQLEDWQYYALGAIPAAFVAVFLRTILGLGAIALLVCALAYGIIS